MRTQDHNPTKFAEHGWIFAFRRPEMTEGLEVFEALMLEIP